MSDYEQLEHEVILVSINKPIYTNLDASFEADRGIPAIGALGVILVVAVQGVPGQHEELAAPVLRQVGEGARVQPLQVPPPRRRGVAPGVGDVHVVVWRVSACGGVEEVMLSWR